MSRAPVASFVEIRRALAEFPVADETARAEAAERDATLTKPPGSLGRLEQLAQWLAAWQGRHPPKLDRPRVAVFAGSHGVARRGVSAYPPEVTAQMVQNFVNGGAAINQLCIIADAELRVYEMAIEDPTEDFTERPAMDEASCARAIAYGMMAVEPGIDLLCVGEMGIGNTTAGAALSATLFGGNGAEWAGPGTGVAGAALARKVAVIDAGLARHRGQIADPLNALRCFGGQEMAAIVGAIIAARMAHVPVLLDGFVSTASAAVLHALAPGALDHCEVAHLSREPGHRRLVAALGKRPLLEFDMHLGEASGAALAIPLLRAAIACHTGMATFAEAGVSGPT
ncbi:MAG: nicotinate-nucleotide--dimethylbenzimidazole phosphoribosyltransferase [Rhodospirillaceae bacterium]|nr:nicotinate-nucleotide--dimethylbenzimidazole phosphoribosyltransferase [Rhodospirillaceae bacterium]